MARKKLSKSQRKKIRFAGILKNKALLGPGSIDILITSQCNIKCLYCTLHSPFNPNKIKPSCIKWPLLKKIIDSLHEINTDSITISGDGEPWLHPQINQIINYIKDKDLDLTINTNLTFLSSKILKSFIRADKLRVNAASLSKNLYCKIHNTKIESYKNLIRNLEFIKKIFKNHKKDLIIITYIVNKLNYKYFPEMVSSLKKYGINNIEVELMEEKKFTKELSLSNKQLNHFRKIIENTRSNVKINYNLDLKDNQKMTNQACYAPHLRSRIEIDGTVAFCCKNENLTIGNINDSSFKKLWFSPKAQKIRFLAANNFNLNDSFWEPCLKCDNFSIKRNNLINKTENTIINE